METASDLRLAEWLADLLDNRFRILGVPVGLDPLLGAMPGAGDLLAAFLSAYLVYVAYRRGLPDRVVRQMLGNIAFDFAIGLVPVIGDVADVFFRANRRNLALLKEHIDLPLS